MRRLRSSIVFWIHCFDIKNINIAKLRILILKMSQLVTISTIITLTRVVIWRATFLRFLLIKLRFRLATRISWFESDVLLLTIFRLLIFWLVWIFLVIIIIIVALILTLQRLLLHNRLSQNFLSDFKHRICAKRFIFELRFKLRQKDICSMIFWEIRQMTF